MESSLSENEEPNHLIDDQELIQRYLLDKILNRPSPTGHVIDTFDLYGYHPDRLPFKEMEEDTESEMYIFMESRVLYRYRIIAVKGGFWAQINDEQPVYAGNIPVGFRKDRIFDNCISQQDQVKSEWMVNEFRVNFEALSVREEIKDMEKEAKKWVACRIIRRNVKPIVKTGLGIDFDFNEKPIDADWIQPMM